MTWNQLSEETVNTSSADQFSYLLSCAISQQNPLVPVLVLLLASHLCVKRISMVPVMYTIQIQILSLQCLIS